MQQRTIICPLIQKDDNYVLLGVTLSREDLRLLMWLHGFSIDPNLGNLAFWPTVSRCLEQIPLESLAASLEEYSSWTTEDIVFINSHVDSLRLNFEDLGKN